MMIVRDLALQYGARVLFCGVSLNLNPRSRYALVGANGAGKSSFLNILGGEEEASQGSVTTPRGIRTGWLKQDQFRWEQTSILNTVIAGQEELWQAMQDREVLLLKDDLTEAEGYRLAECEQVMIEKEGYMADTVAADLLKGLGISEGLHHQPLAVLSGGYKLRVLLAQALFAQPDVLLLDEPTNHLDLPSIQWLESYLNRFSGVLVVISHDISFLNGVATHVLDVDYGEIRIYTGNYDRFVVQKKQVEEQKIREADAASRKIAEMQAFVDRFRAGTRARQAASREKAMEKVELPDVLHSSRQAPAFRFGVNKPSGKTALKIQGVGKAFGDKVVLNQMELVVQRGDKIIIIGPNGIGKSTLLKILTGAVIPDTGTFTWGAEVSLSWFSQDHHDMLNENLSVLAWLEKACPGVPVPVPVLRRTLGCVLFRQDDVFKSILSLSGGESARLLLARIMLLQTNVMLLDEPTNHLDIESREALKKALVEYPGTLMMVTHDRDFAASVANRIVALTPRGVQSVLGNYEDYMRKYGTP